MVQGNDFQRMLSNEIFDYVKRRDIPVGSRLTEKSLCEEFNVSRTPVRAALKILANDGFIEYVRNKGYFTRQDGGAINRRAAPETDEELLYLRLTRDRLEGELASEFTEADLLRRYEVPKRILTRVLQRLLREMLIEKRPGRGWSFAAMLDSKQAHDESYQFRLCIEPAALLEPTFAADARRIAQSRADHERIIEGSAEALSSVALFEMNADFHQMLADFSGNRFFRQAMRRQNSMRRIISYQWVYGPERVIETCQEHLAILAAVADGDRMWAAGLLRQHIAGAANLNPYGDLAETATDPWRIDVARR
jgi:DNA-binding GntR family transcriptional regulator